MGKKYKLYLKMYVTTKGTILNKFTHLGQIKVFDYIIRKCNKETLRWNIDKTNRIEITDELEIGDSTLNNYLAQMASEKIGALKRLSRGSYEINREFIDTDLTK